MDIKERWAYLDMLSQQVDRENKAMETLNEQLLKKL